MLIDFLKNVMIKKISIRVYGLWIKDKMVLLSDERLKGFEFTKFPGGGLELGESTVDCLKREMLEETGLECTVLDHFYTTDFFQESAFYPDNQVLSIYYLMDGPEIPEQILSDKPFRFKETGDDQKLRWVSLSEIDPKDVSFPIDKKVVQMIREKFN